MTKTNPRIGQIFPRQDGYAKVTGREKYAVDYYDTGLVWAGVKRAGIPHGRLLGLNIQSAKTLPGVLAILTCKDVPGSNRQGIIQKDQPLLVDDKARHCGDAVVLVLAEDKEILQKALGRIMVDWEPLPGVFDPEEALREGAPLIHETYPGGNTLLKGEILKGQAEAGLKESEVLVEASFEFPHQEHAYLETEAGMAILKPNGFLEMIVSTQTPFRDRLEVAETVGFEPEKIRIMAPYCGGAFGGKDGLTVQSLLALAALHCPGRPVKMWWNREESFLASAKRHPVRLSYRLGAKRDGTFQALEAKLVYDTGPYDHLGGAVTALGLEHAGGPYRIPHVKLQAWAVYTNNPIGGAFRGFGVPQVTAAMEQVVDLMADKLGLSPLDLRIQNAFRQGELNTIGVTLTGSVGLGECLSTLKGHPLWKEQNQWKAESPRFKKRGIGMAALMHGLGYGPVIPDVARAKIELTLEGKFRIYSGVVDMGQGNATTYLQMAGALLNQEASSLEIVLPDTERTLPSGSASASRTTFTFGRALIGAVEAIQERILKQAARDLRIELLNELELVPGRVVHRLTGREVWLSVLASTLDDSQRIAVFQFQAPTCLEIPTQDRNLRLHGIPHLIFSYGAHLAAVEVDELSGQVEIIRYLSVTDCGRVINPQIYEQQIEGGICQGLGYALYEDFKVQQGKIQTPDLATYIIPTSRDVPDMDTLAVEIPEPNGPFGMKGAGEIALAGPLPAIANAVADAIGTRIFQSPLTAERVWAALQRS